jgi:hypothetical protein
MCHITSQTMRDIKIMRIRRTIRAIRAIREIREIRAIKVMRIMGLARKVHCRQIMHISWSLFYRGYTKSFRPSSTELFLLHELSIFQI